MRPLSLVIDATAKLVPYDFPGREDMVEDLEKVKDSVKYTAPEAMYIRWDEYVQVLMFYIPEPKSEWQRDIQSLVADRIDYRDVLNA